MDWEALTFNDYVNYWNFTGKDAFRVWDNFKTPQNDDFNFSRKDFFGQLMKQLGNMELYTSDPIQLKVDIASFTACMLPSWQRALDALAASYEPLWNYDRTEDETNERDTKSNTVSESSSQSAARVAGYDSGELVDNSDATSGAQSSADLTENEGNSRHLRAYGNIGVTSSQELVQQEIEVSKLSIYNIMIDDIKNNFCILVY